MQASPDSGFSSIASAVTTANSSATLTGLLPQTIYFMHVQASNQAGTQTSFVILPQATTLTVAPNAPNAAGFTGVDVAQLTANWTTNGNPGGTLYNAVLSTAPSPSTNGLSGNKTISTTNLAAPFTPLLPNTLYFVEVNAQSAGGNSAYTSLGSVPTLANQPTPGNPTNIATNQVTANWGTNGNPAGTLYTVQASVDPGFASIASAVTTANSSATLTGLLPQTTYFMHVQSSNQSAVATAFVLLPQATTLTTPPNVPNASGFTGINITQLTANWTANGNPAGTLYNAVLSTAPAPGVNGLPGNKIISTTNLFAPFTLLSPNTLYYVDVDAQSSGGSSAYTGLGTVVTLANSPTPGNPTNIATNQITANWGINGNPAGTLYTVQASVDPGFASIASAVTTANSSATLTGLLPQTTYFMHVQASNQSAVATAFVLLPQAATLTTPPNVPNAAGLTGISITQLTANWTANGNPAGTLYNAVLSTAPSPSTNGLSGNKLINTTNLSATFSLLSPNTLYFVEVNAQSAGGNSTYTDLGAAPTLATLPSPASPTAITGSQVTANWLANGNPIGTTYLAQAGTDPTFNSNFTGIVTSSLGVTFTGLTPQTTYYMQVAAINQRGSQTAFTPLPTILTLGNPPVAPFGASFNNVTTSQLQANWLQNGNSAGTFYNAVLSTAPFPSSNGAAGNKTLTGTGTFATFTGLLPNTLYYAAVNASNQNGESVYTSLGSVATLANQPTAASPTNIQANQITANWNAAGNPPGTLYQVQASLNITFTNIVVTTNTVNTSVTLIGLSPATTYFMHVQAVNQSFVGTNFTDLPSTVTLANAPAIPGPLSFSNVTATQLQANWTSNGNPSNTNYIVVLSTSPSPSSNGLGGNRTNTTTNTSSVFTGLIPNTFYYADVRASNSNGQSAVTSLNSVVTLANAPTSASPSGIGINQLTANWGPNGNPADTLYFVEIGFDPNFGSFINFSPTTSTFATFGGLSGNTTYYMRVQAISQGAQPTAFTILPAAQTVFTVPTVPVLSALQITDSSILWSWSPGAANAIGYSVFDQNFVQVSPSFGSNILQWQDTGPSGSGLAVNTPYSRQVVAFNASGASTSTLVTVYTQAHPVGTVSAPSQGITSNSITIVWDSNGNPSNTTYVATINPSGRQITVTNPTVMFDNLAGATTYFFSVQAFNGDGVLAPGSGAAGVTSAATLPQTETSNQICQNTSSSLAFNGPRGPVRVDIPAGAFSSCVQMTITIPGTFPSAPSSGTPLQGTGVGIQLADDLLLQPLLPITLTVPFTNGDVSPDQRGQLVLARYDTDHNAWVMLPSVLNPDQNSVTAQTSHLSLYQIMVALPASDISNVRVYPNPFRPSMGHTGVNFANLPTDAGIQIFNLSGEKVRSLSSTATGTAFWDGHNESGQSAASGVYFAVVKSGSAKTIVKVAIER